MNTRLKNRLIKNQSGLTLVEIIVVLVILSLVMGFLIKGIFGQSQGAKAILTEMKIGKLKGAINQYQLMHNRLPPALQSLVSCDQASGAACVPLVDKDDLNDAWNTPMLFNVEGTGRSYQIKSLGADGREGGSGTDGDISSTGP